MTFLLLLEIKTACVIEFVLVRKLRWKDLISIEIVITGFPGVASTIITVQRGFIKRVPGKPVSLSLSLIYISLPWSSKPYQLGVYFNNIAVCNIGRLHGAVVSNVAALGSNPGEFPSSDKDLFFWNPFGERSCKNRLFQFVYQ